MEQIKRVGLTSLELKLVAMICMLCDHMWATIISGSDWLTCLGRVAFPIFAFQIAEGYAHTGDVKAYRRRLLIWALISELPFNLMVGGGLIYPFHQNVMFTFWLALLVLERIDRARLGGGFGTWVTAVAWVLAGYLLGFVTMVDYFGYGVLTVVWFYFFRDKLTQLAGMLLINVVMMEGLTYPVHVLDHVLYIPQQAFALLALIPIWLYNGQQGPYNKTIRRLCYAFYPGHILILTLLGLYVLN